MNLLDPRVDPAEALSFRGSFLELPRLPRIGPGEKSISSCGGILPAAATTETTIPAAATITTIRIPAAVAHECGDLCG
jgi:hypothetical protein